MNYGCAYSYDSGDAQRTILDMRLLQGEQYPQDVVLSTAFIVSMVQRKQKRGRLDVSGVVCPFVVGATVVLLGFYFSHLVAVLSCLGA